MNPMNSKGTAVVEVIAVVAVIALGTWLLKPSLIPGTAAHRAKKSSQATQQVQSTTVAADTAARAQGATVAAGLTAIGQANSEAPASPTKNFIDKEVPYLLTMLPAPDPLSLRAANERRLAEMSGRLEESRRLYEIAYKRAEELQQERDAAVAARDAALAARQAADLALEKAAAAEHARTMQALGVGVVAVLLLAGWIYTRVYSIGPKTLGHIAADIRSGTDPIHALDTHLAPRLHSRVRTHAKLASEPS